MTDDELLKIIDEQHLWIVPVGMTVATCSTLREALRRAYQISAEGKSPGPIKLMPDAAVEVPVEQIYRLWQSIGLRR